MTGLPLGDYGFTIAIYVISIMIAVSGISLGIGYALNEKRFKEFGKEELYQCIINGALIGGMIALFSSGGIVSNMISSVTLVNGTSLNCSAVIAQNPAICLSYDYLAGTGDYAFMGVQHQSIFSMSTSMITGLFGLDAILGIIAAIKINLVIVTLSFNYVIAPIINEIQYLIKILSTIAISSLVQASVLVFIAIGTLSLILPVGLILRSFYPTRKLGGFLVAISIGLYVVLPLSYVFNIMLVNSYSAAMTSPNIGQITLNASDVQNSLFAFGSITNSSKLTSISSGISGLVSSFAGGVSGAINDLLSAVSYFIVYTFVLPAFSLIITGISIREFSEIFGSEAHFGMLKMLG